MSQLAPLARAMLVGTLAGLAVGLVDGLRSAFPFAQGWPALGSTLVLAMSVDGLLGGLGGFVIGCWVVLRAWGHSAKASDARRAIALVVAGAVAASFGVVATVSMAMRVNRFLAAGVVVLVLLAGWLLCMALAPALARLLNRSPAPGGSLTTSFPGSLVGRWWSAPMVLGLCSLAAFVVVWRTRAPLRGPALWERSAWVAAIACLAPLLISMASRWPRQSRLPPVLVRGLPLALGVTAGLILLVLRWQHDLQYLPWADILVATAIAALGVALFHASAHRVPRPLVPAALVWMVCFPLAMVTAPSEVARKHLAARGGLVGPSLAFAMRLFDADHDGYARSLGGGDCNDDDVDINPAALDWPEDGVDQDCDGKDASWGALASPAFHPVPEAVPRKLNILLIAVDTLRADRVGIYGYRRNTTPNIDALAKQGVVFDNGWAHAPSTRYSMPAIVTGRWPSAIEWEGGGFCNDCRSWWPRFSPKHRTVGQALKAAGYFTGSLWAYSYFDADERRGFERGMDVYDTRRAALHTNLGGPAESLGSSAREVTDDALSFLSQHGDKTFFLTVHYYDPHLSYERHPEAPDFGSQPSDLYDGEVWFTDHHLGRLFQQLKAQGLWENTAIVVTGDHGEGFGERGIVAHGYHLYPPQTKVPFIARVPGLAARRVPSPISHVDLAPTLVNLARAQPEPTFLGRSFVDLLAGPVNASVPLSPVFQEVSYEGDNKKRGIVTQTHQLIWNWTPHNTTECYDLSQAKGADIWDTAAGVDACPPLKAQLRKWLALLALPADVQEKMSASVFGSDRAAPAPQQKLEARIGDALQFLGLDVSNTQIARGEAVDVSFHFQALDRPPEGWRMFFHLNGPQGVFLNLDHAPVSGAFPLDRWRRGQTVIDTHHFSVPPNLPPGTYELFLGMWRGGERLPITPPDLADGSNRLRVATFHVR